MCRQSFLVGECKFHQSGYQSDDFSRRDESWKRGRSNGYRAVVSLHEEQTGEPIRIDVWKQKRKTTSPFPTLVGKRLYAMHIFFTSLTSNKPQLKTDIAGLCAGCVWLIKKESQLVLTERLGIVWDTDLPYSLKSSTREDHGGGKQVKITSKTPDHLLWFKIMPPIPGKYV